MRLQINNDAIRALKEHAERQMSTNVQQQHVKLQGVYDRVLAAGQGKTVDEVKALLAQEWRSAFGQEMTGPNLSKAANVLAEGRRIEVRLEVCKLAWH